MCKLAVEGCKEVYAILRNYVLESSAKTLLCTS